MLHLCVARSIQQPGNVVRPATALRLRLRRTDSAPSADHRRISSVSSRTNICGFLGKENRRSSQSCISSRMLAVDVSMSHPHLLLPRCKLTTGVLAESSSDHAKSTSTRFDSNGSEPTKDEKQIAMWLLALCAMVFFMVLLGGATRLTESGLSITEWKPFKGARPPLTEDDWKEEFEKYRRTPEFQKLHSHMNLEDFKFIYLMEWGHRQWGRVIGLAYLFPFLYFLSKGALKSNPQLQRRLAAIFCLGGMQGALGWYMVRSGLEVDVNSHDVPRVSPYRLTAHLISAFGLYSAMLWTALGLLHKKPHAAMSNPQLSGIRAGATAAAALAVTTIASGAFVAGNDAGYAYNTWPLMQDQFIPDGLLEMRPAWKNLFENTLTVQFDHRMLAYTTAAVVWTTWLRSRKFNYLLPKRSRMAITSMAHMTTLQVALGITTLLTIVPVPLGVLHQAGGLTMLSLSVWTMHELRRAARTRTVLAAAASGKK